VKNSYLLYSALNKLLWNSLFHLAQGVNDAAEVFCHRCGVVLVCHGVSLPRNTFAGWPTLTAASDNSTNVLGDMSVCKWVHVGCLYRKREHTSIHCQGQDLN
jgi:hypothetical protein